MKKWAIGILSVLLFVFTILFIGLPLLRKEPKATVKAANFEQGVQLEFGLGREAISRSVRLNLCDSDELKSTAECTNPESKVPRPEVLSANLQKDLVSSDGKQFPTSQFGISATNVGRFGLLVTVNANPSTPDDVVPAEYHGDIVIDRSAGPLIMLPINASLVGRGGTTALKVILALLLGALLGTLVKWLEDTFSPLAVLRRRQRNVKRRLDPYKTALPEDALLPVDALAQLDAVNQAVKDLDLPAVEEPLQRLYDGQQVLTNFAKGIKYLREQIQIQRDITNGDADLRRIAGIAMDAEKDYISTLRDHSWPWSDTEAVLRDLSDARRVFGKLTGSIRAAQSNRDQAQYQKLETLVNQIVNREQFDKILAQETSDSVHSVINPTAPTATAQPRNDPPSGPAAATAQPPIAPAPTAGEKSDKDPPSLALWLLDNAWWLVLLVIAAVIIFIGYQTQFIDNPAFEGDAADYVQLVAWALAIQVAGGTILETIGKLRTSSPAGPAPGL